MSVDTRPEQQGAPPAEPTLEVLAERLDTAMAALAELDGESARVGREVHDALGALHRLGLVTIVRRLREDPRGKELLFELVDEPDVHMLLSMSGIIRPDPTTAAQGVIERVRPGLQSHGGDVTLVAVEDGVAQVRLSGACNGCSMAAVTMRDGVEAALVEGVPGITGVEVLPNDPTPTLIPLSSIGMRPSDDDADVEAELRGSGWHRTHTADEVPVGALLPVRLDGPAGPVDVIVVNAAGTIAAYVNACAHLGVPLDDGLLDADAGTLTCSRHGFCYDTTNGECLTMPGAQLDPLPLRLEAGGVWVRPST